jgi:hypothetical protein
MVIEQLKDSPDLKRNSAIVLRCIYTIALYSYYPNYVVRYLSYCVERGLVSPAWKCGLPHQVCPGTR